MKEFDFVHTGNYCYTESQLKVMKEAGIKISFDFSDDSSKEYYEKYAPYITYAFCSFDGDDEAAKEHLNLFIHWDRSWYLLPEVLKAALCMMVNSFIHSRQHLLTMW